MKRAGICTLLLGLTLAPTAAWALPESLQTSAQKSGFQITGRYDEVPRLAHAFAQRWPDRVRVETFGTSPEGRPMLALVVSGANALTPEQARAKNLPVMLFQGGIHSGEIDGKDAGFWALGDMLERDEPSLKNVVLVFVPVFNVDGHERFGRWNRPNQNGPEEMGWRVTSANLNLNRDYAKAESPEMRAMLGLLNRWDPILYVDLHATDGARFQPDVAVLVEPKYVGDPELFPMTRKMQTETMSALKAKGSMPLDFYPSFRTYTDPASGFSDSAYPPRFSTGYWALHNRMAMLVETHSWKSYPERVKVTREILEELTRLGSRDGREWLAKAKAADRAASNLGGKEVAVKYRTAEKNSKTLDFPGYAYSWVDSSISGGKALVYDVSKPVDWKVPFYEDVETEVLVKAPSRGYYVPAAHAGWMGEKLRSHGIAFETLEKPAEQRPFEVFRASEVKLAPKTLEGKTVATLQGEWRAEPQTLPSGSLFVPIAQPNSRLVMALLEPRAPDSYAAWGFFNAHFEQKEYMEEYVLEQIAPEMMREHPEIRREFEQRLKDDPEFAKSSEARLEFFYQKHPSYDCKQNLYPVLRD